VLDPLPQVTQVEDELQQPTASKIAVPQNEARREWLARLRLQFTDRRGRTTLTENTHEGPLSVQRPFYPEANPCCHVYMLHPPGGLVAGDRIGVELSLQPNTHALLTTPSAGKIYRTDAASHLQQQHLHADIEYKACLEWLPQETIVFAGANARIHNRFHLQQDAQLIAWDVVCLGRRASNDLFDHGYCEQLIEVKQNHQLLLRERNCWPGDSSIMQAPWGMAGNCVAGTLLATVVTSQQQRDTWREHLTESGIPGEWGMTQKPAIFIARYLGVSAQDCRRGFELLWQHLRKHRLNIDSCRPRIWNT